ncbi:Sugar phosphate isomerase/epimerase [Sulfitobacter marinus]|uniref:Sugar phosphate isomerase/epimerase n=1 Tax=Sulfitobacter marinus TaxID=394264 RepID=A0A1I6VDF5_9RHOB|nr:sugar phosphate isomerase/epimerase family protein [Sulfitobacter marinus]SFT11692.1 Sugar phosphate isomerase/epimerase [Sulfitobacter marinus]
MIPSVSNIAWSVEDRLNSYAVLENAGVEGLEIAPGLFFSASKDPFNPDASTARTALGEITAHGLSLVSMQSLLFGVPGASLLGSSDERAALERGMIRAIELGGRFGIPNLVFGSPAQRRIPDGMCEEQSWSEAADTFRRLGDKAVREGCVIAIESNPEIYGTNFLTTLEQAEAFVTMVDHPGITLILDLGAMHINGTIDTVAGRVNNFARKLSHVHVSEPQLAPAPKDVSTLGPILSALVSSGYSRAVSIEMKQHEGGLEILRSCVDALLSGMPAREGA